MFKLHKGKTKVIPAPVAASGGAIAEGALVAYSSGTIIAATSTTPAKDILGVLRKAIATTDSDYATARMVPVEVPLDNNTEWEADVTSGLVAADIGLFQDLTDSVTVNRAASTYDIVQCRAVLSTTKGIFVLNIGNAGQASVTA